MTNNKNTTPYTLSGDVVCQWQRQHFENSEGKLSGLRLAVKDLFHLAHLPTSAGNPDWLGTHPLPRDTSPVVCSMLSEGAELVGKTLTDELAYSLNGQNVHYGTPVNPVCEDRLPGGSSSGSAVAVSRGSADIGLGTDTGGSIRVPASYNGLFGLRPTHGVISTEHMVALAPSFDTVGWMCKSLENLMLVADVLLPDQEQPLTNSPKYGLTTQMLSECEQGTEIEKWSQSLASNVVKLAHFDPVSWQASETFRVLQGTEIWQQHGHWIETTKPRFAADIAARFQWCQQIDADTQASAQRQQQQIVQGINQLFEHVDVIIMPTTPGAAPLLSSTDSELASYRNQLMNLTAPAGLAGLPQVHLPLFNKGGAPMGVSLLGPRHSDRYLLRVAQQLIGINA